MVDLKQSRSRLILFIDDGPGRGYPSGTFREITGSPFPTAITWWTSAAKTKKIFEKLITRDASQNATSITYHTFKVDGVAVDETAVDTIALSGPFEVSRTRVLS